jgi:hypothetical protein
MFTLPGHCAFTSISNERIAIHSKTLDAKHYQRKMTFRHLGDDELFILITIAADHASDQ